jgi:hypothetical protein
MLRPHVVWFGEGLEEEILGKKSVFESASDMDPDPVFYLNPAPDPGSQTNADLDLDSDLALLSHYIFALCTSGNRFGNTPTIGNYGTKAFSKSCRSRLF